MSPLALPTRVLLLTALATGILTVHASPVPPDPALAGARVSSCPSAETPGNPSAQPPNVVITFKNECGDNVPLAVDVAATESEQESGLMNVSDLPEDQGELFAFQNIAGGSEVGVGFWMEDTPIPLSIAFIGPDGYIHEIQDMQAETTNVHLPRSPYLYAVETNLGWFSRHSILPGDRVDLSQAASQLGAAVSATPAP
jgi:uncharacterized protein